MKLLIPIGSFYPDQSGGPSNSLYWLSSALQQKGYTVKVITTNKGVNQLSLNKSLKTDYGYITYCKTRIHSFPLRLILTSLHLIFKTDIVLLTSIFYIPSWVIGFVALLFNKTIIWSPRGEFYTNALSFSGWKKKIFLFFAKPMLRRKNIIYHSSCDAETITIKSIIGEYARIVQLPNFMKLPRHIQRITDLNYFLYVGRLHPEKGLENLITSLSISKEFCNSNYEFRIVGDYNHKYGRKLIKLTKLLSIEHKVKFMGHIKGDDKQELYANARYTFLVSFNENFGNVVVESLAQGTPVVASLETPWRILSEKNAGFWIANKPKIIKQTIDTILIQDEKTYYQYRANALCLAKNNFDINRNISSWLQVFESIVQSGT